MKTMEDVSLAQAKDHLEELIERATRGEDVRISDPRLGTVRLQPVAERPTGEAPERRPGRWKGRFTVPARLFEPLTDEELAWLSGERSK
jgi:prevent-host-death family protein